MVKLKRVTFDCDDNSDRHITPTIFECRQCVEAQVVDHLE